MIQDKIVLWKMLTGIFLDGEQVVSVMVHTIVNPIILFHLTGNLVDIMGQTMEDCGKKVTGVIIQL